MTEIRVPAAPPHAAVLPVATLPGVRSIVVRRLSGSRRVIGIHARPEWAGEPSFRLGDVVVHVRACPSALAVREAIKQHGDGYLVVLTDVDDADLGAGLRVHLAGSRLYSLRPWEMIKQAFEAHTLDPLLLDEGWAASALTRWEPTDGWSPAPGGALTRDHTLGHLASVVFGEDPSGVPYLAPGHPDAPSLLRWTLDPVAIGRLGTLPADVRDGLTGWLSTVTGPAGKWTLRAVAAGHGGDAVPLALTAGLLWLRTDDRQDAASPAGGSQDAASPTSGSQDAEALVAEARGLVRARLGGADLPAEQAQSWARAAQALIGQIDRPESLLERAEALLHEFNAATLITRSNLLPEAYAVRLREFAQAIRLALPAPGSTPPHALDGEALRRAEEAHAHLVAHELAEQNPRTHAARMALRLLRWLAVREESAPTLADALHEQVRTGAYVEWAFADVWSGDHDNEVAAAYRALLDVVAVQRAERDRVLARHLAVAVAADSDPGTLVPIESALTVLVRPLGRSLLVVLDGMTAGVLAELADELLRNRWTELVDASLGHRRVLLPALPTVTEVCRTSLLTGSLRTGAQHDEKAAFPAATGDPQARLFHKDDLRAPGGHALHPAVKAAVEGTARVVGVVLNAVDDSLDKMDPGGTTWSLEQVQHLRALANAARVAGRTLILTADHGHVVERGGTALSAPGVSAARWRPADGRVTDGEIEVRGPRVLLGGGAVVLPWREDLRYGSKRAGYHGGASAAEVAVPFAVFSPVPVDEIANWRPAPAQEPIWWNTAVARLTAQAVDVIGTHEGYTQEVPRGQGEKIAKANRPRKVLEGQAELLALDEVLPAPALPPVMQPAAAADGSPRERFLNALLASDLFEQQRARAGRAAPDVTRVRGVLAALLEGGGRLHESTLSAAAQVPAARLRTVLAAVRRVLSVDGYDPISYDSDGVTVVLSVDVLAEQFGIPAP
ncbi:BREX-2 system phosphatase PglZ [Microbispora hainanensis]|uniref:BREX-2 system phosphatase PglZ n=1 Tax=Microbispora hainanensis TaxID=568844 RepID=UPI0032525674